MKVKPFTLGPLMGETSRHRARMLVRGNPALAPTEHKPFLGRLQWRRAGGAWSAPLRFRFNRNFDFTAVVVLDELKAGTDYQVRGGWVPEDGINDSKLDWRHASVGGFRTAPADPAAPVDLLFGSCCYRLFRPGGKLEDDRADKAFRGMWREQRERGAVDFVLFAGDQVYADPLSIVGDLHSQEAFYRLYRMAWSQPHALRLLAHTSTYMILDDHEIENGWPANASPQDRLAKYPAALKAYQIYQASHGPATPLTANGRWLAHDPEHLWYEFSRGCVDFFVMDVRTERAGAAGEVCMLSPEQEAALLAWLDRAPERVKCIVSPVVMFPDAHPLFSTGDAWDGYPRQRTRILEAIRRRELDRVVFLGGDVHASLCSRLSCRGPSGKRLRMLSLVSSGLFWPSLLFPFRWRSGMVKDAGQLTTPGTRTRYRVEPLTDIYSGNGFARLRFTPDAVTFELRDRKGEPLPQYRNHFTFSPK